VILHQSFFYFEIWILTASVHDISYTRYSQCQWNNTSKHERYCLFDSACMHACIYFHWIPLKKSCFEYGNIFVVVFTISEIYESPILMMNINCRNDHVSDTGSGEPLILFIIILPVLFKSQFDRQPALMENTLQYILLISFICIITCYMYDNVNSIFSVL
jgi:hypothetical protein